jgi:HAD superfamily hydrolase (TIGR01509 family)
MGKFIAGLFDWDGLLADTEPCWSLADIKWMNANGAPYHDELKHLLTGRNQSDCVTTLMNAYGLTLSVEEAKILREEALYQVYEQMEFIGGSDTNPDDRKRLLDERFFMPGANNLVSKLRKLEIPLAIVSGSSKKILNVAVPEDFKSNFNLVLSCEGIKGKPAPDSYLEAAKQLGVDPRNCIVFEDAQSGVESAYNAGMYCIAVPNKYTRHQDFSKAGLVVPSLLELTPERLKGLLR